MNKMNELESLNIISGVLLILICTLGIAIKIILKKKLEDIDGVSDIVFHSEDEYLF